MKSSTSYQRVMRQSLETVNLNTFLFSFCVQAFLMINLPQSTLCHHSSLKTGQEITEYTKNYGINTFFVAKICG